MNTQYLVTAAKVSDDSPFEEQFHRLENELEAHGFGLTMVGESQTAVQAVEEYEFDKDGGRLTLYASYQSDVRHLEIATSGPEDANQIAQLAIRCLDVESHEELMQRWREGTRTPHLIAKVAYSSPEPIPQQVLDTVSEGIADANSEVRCMAAYACAILAHPSFETLLLRRSTVELEPTVLAFIEHSLQLYGYT